MPGPWISPPGEPSPPPPGAEAAAGAPPSQLSSQPPSQPASSRPGGEPASDLAPAGAPSASWPEELLQAVLHVCLPLATLLGVLGAAVAALKSNWPVVLSIAVGWVALAVVAGARRGSTRWRALGLVAVWLGMGAALLVFEAGAFGLLWLMAAPALGALWLGGPAALGLGLGVALLGFGWAGWTALPLDPPLLADDPRLKWVLLALNHAVLALLLVLAVALLRQRLSEALAQVQQARRAYQRLAETDTLTGLPNRRKFHAELRQTLQRSQHHGGADAAVLLVDVDHFKDINDTYGHLEGDQMLLKLSQLLLSHVGAPSVVARMGGDEFVVLYRPPPRPGVPLREQVLELALRLRELLSQPLELASGLAHRASLSVGVSLLDRPHLTVEDVMREADTAMYQAKTQGRNRVLFFTPDMHDALRERVLLERELRAALESGHGLHLVVQAQTDVLGRLVGAEVLCRWHHPALGPISPAQFIPVAERSGLVVQLGQWVLEQACALSHALAQRGKTVPISVNISVRQFRSPAFERLLLDTLEWQAVSPAQLVLEVTESLLATDHAETIALMQRLADKGLRFSIDDFGTGYSSLSYLKTMPLYELKIDRSFVDGLPDDGNDVAIVKTILSMAREMGLAVVAEGVETDAQLAFLCQHGCPHVQGYRFSRPLPVAQWLDRWAP